MENINTISASTETLRRIIINVTKAIENEEPENVFLAFLMFIITFQKPNLTSEELQASVFNISQLIALDLSNTTKGITH